MRKNLNENDTIGSIRLQLNYLDPQGLYTDLDNWAKTKKCLNRR